MTTALTKSEILADEGRFQRACSIWVSRYIGSCVSSLMYDVGQNLEECSRIFDFDYDEAIGWFQRDDWEEPVLDFINDAGLEDLETIADMVGYWDDVLDEAGVPKIHYSENDDEEYRNEEWRFFADGVEHAFDDEEEAIEAARMSVIDSIREKIKGLIESDDEFREIANHFDLDPNTWEIYEHWTIKEGYIARLLQQHSQVVFDFGGMCIWARGATGQSISMDYVIRQIVRELDESHWIWGEVR